LTLLGLIVGIGMLVDNAVVVIENIARHQELGRDRRTAARLGSREVSTAVIAATLTSVIVFLPMIFNKPSEMNLYLKELGITVSLTLLASLFISQTLIPLATSWFIHSKPRPKQRWMLAIESRYQALLRLNLDHRWLAPIFYTAVALSIVYPFNHVDKNFDTNESELFVQVNYQFSEEASLEKKEAVVTEVEQRLESHRDELLTRSVYSFWSDRWAMTRFYLDEGQANEDNIAAVRERLRALLPELPGLKLEVQENRQFWRADRGKRVAFQVVGEDSEVLAALAEAAKSRLEAIPGLFEPFSSNQEGNQELHVMLDDDLASRYGITPAQAADVIGLTFRGRRLRRFRTSDSEREMRLTLDERQVESRSQLSNLPLWTRDGDKVALASVADVEERRGAERIQRDERMTSVWVGAQYRDGTREDYMPAVQQALASMDFPFGYSWSFGRWERRRAEQSRELLVNMMLALLLIFAVMAGLFESVRQAIALMIAVPLALTGGGWTLLWTGTDFDQPAFVGMLLLIGVVVNNGIVMIEHINMYRRDGMDRRQAMERGARERLRPIIMTAVTTLIGLVPIVVQRPSLGGVYYYSMALFMMGGLAVSTFLTPVLLPTIVTLIEDVPGAVRRAAGWTVRLVRGRRTPAPAQ